MSAEKLISRLEEMGLVDAALLAKLRRQVAEAHTPISMEAVAKRLIADGQITLEQAKKLIAQIKVNDRSGTAKPATSTVQKPATEKRQPAAPAPVNSDDMGLTPLDEIDKAPAKPVTKAAPQSAPEKKTPAADDLMELVDLDDEVQKPVAATPPPASNAPKPGGGDKKVSPSKKTAVELSPLAELMPMGGEELMPLDSAGLAPLGGGDMFGELSNPAGGEPGSLGAAKPASQTAAVKKLSSSGWDSPLMLMGGGALLLLLFAGAILLYSLSRSSADELFGKAEVEYKNQTYDKAIIIYDSLVKSYPTHNKASLAKVRRGLAKLRQVIDQSKDMRSALEMAKTVIPEIEVEQSFADGRDELAAMLPKIAEDFAAKAKIAQTGKAAQELVTLGEQAMELVNNPSYITAQMRESMQARTETIRRTLEESKRTIQQDEALKAALLEIETLVTDGNTVTAFELRRKLLKEFPALETDVGLSKAVLAIAAREKDLVKVGTESIAAAPEDILPSVKTRKLILSHRKGEAAPGQDNQVAFVMVRGAVLGMEVGSGKILWRRFVGQETLIHPVPLGKDAAADALVVDARRHELLRLEARTGKVLWRLPVGEPFAAPALPAEQLIVTTASGRLLEVHPESGHVSRLVVVPQQTLVSASGDARLPTFYQVGGHSNIYICSSETLACQEVFYLGHKPGSVAVPPVNSLDHLFVVENAGLDHCLLHVLKVNKAGLELKSVQEPFRMAGNVSAPLIQIKNRVVVLTNLGEARVLEVDGTREKNPVKEVAKQVATSKTPEAGFSLADANMIWLASQRLSAFDVQTSRGQLNSKWSQHEGEPFVAPLQRFGNVLVHARRRRGSAGITVSAAKIDSGQLIWRTDVGVPAAYVGNDPPRKQTVAINANGDLYRFDLNSLQLDALDKPIESAEPDGSEIAFQFGDAVPLNDGRVAFSHQVDRRSLLVFNPELPRDSVSVTRLATGERTPTTALQPYAGGVIALLDNGQVALLNVDTGKARALPFQPRVEPGSKIEWQAAALIGADRKEFVVTENRRKLFRIGVRVKPEPNLFALQEIESPAVISRPLAVAGDTLYGVSRDVGEDVIHAFALPGLTVGQEWRLKGRVTDGPWQVGGAVIVATDSAGILCFGAGQNQTWTAPLVHGPLAGPPVLDGQSFIFAARSGVVWRAASDSGQEIGRAELQDSLSGSAVPLGNVIYFSTSDGSLIAIPTIPAS